MELMETCFDKLKKKVGGPLPEPIIGKLSVAVSFNFLLLFVIFIFYLNLSSEN